MSSEERCQRARLLKSFIQQLAKAILRAYSRYNRSKIHIEVSVKSYFRSVEEARGIREKAKNSSRLATFLLKKYLWKDDRQKPFEKEETVIERYASMIGTKVDNVLKLLETGKHTMLLHLSF